MTKIFLKINKLIKNRTNLWIIAFSFALAIDISILIYQQIFNNSSLTLTNFSNRTIGVTVLSGIDANLRTYIYIFLLIIFTIILVGIIYVIKAAIFYVQDKYNFSLNREERLFILVLSEFVIFESILYFFFQERIQIKIVFFLYYIIFIIFIYCLLRLISNINRYIKTSLIFTSNYYWLVLILILAYSSTIFSKIIIGIQISYDIYFLIINSAFIIIYTILVNILLFLQKNNDNNRERLLNSFAFSSIFIFLIPLSIPLSNEIQYMILDRIGISPRKIACIISGILIMLTFIAFVLNYKKIHLTIKPSRLFNFVYCPIFIISNYIFRFHTHFINFVNIDLFHIGETALSTHQLFNFGSIPFLDIYPTHSLSTSYTQILYSLMNGYNGLESLLWFFIIGSLGIILIYFLIYLLTKNSIFSLLLIMVTPINIIFPVHFSIIILTALSLLIFMKYKNILSYIILQLVFLFMIFWRIDFGIIALIGGYCVLGVFYLKNRDIRSKRLILSAIIFWVICIFLFLMIFYLRGIDIFYNISLIIQFLKIQGASASYIDIIKDYSPITSIQYFILPISAVLILVYLFYKIINKSKKISKIEYLIIFIAIFSLIASFRSVQRHGLIEEFNGYLFIFLIFTIPYVIKVRKSYLVRMFIYIIILILFIIPIGSLSYGPQGSLVVDSEPENPSLIKSDPVFIFNYWKEKGIRLNIADSSGYANIVDFLKDNLKDGETFFDFANAPLLYVFSNKKFPSYIIPNLYHTSELIQKDEIERLSKLFNEHKLPLIIFKQGTWWDTVDGVPNEIRSYRIVEFIYKNFHPICKINDYEVWAVNGFSIDKEKAKYRGYNITEINTTEAQNFNLNYLPYIWANYDEFDVVNKTEKLSIWNINQVVSANSSIDLQIDEIIDKSTGNYLQLRASSVEEASIIIQYGIHTNNTFTFTIKGGDIEKNYIIRLSTQYEWVSQTIRSIRITSDKDVKVTEIFIRKGD